MIAANVPNLPYFVSSTPANGTLQVKENSNITLQFSHPVKPGSGYIFISNGLKDLRSISVNDLTQISFNSVADGTDNLVSINPTADLFNNASYYVQFADGVFTDLNGNPVKGVSDTFTIDFTTAPPDTTPPIPVNSIPGDEATQVPIDNQLSVTFNEAIQAGSGNFIISNGQGDTRKYNAHDTSRILINDNTLTINDVQKLLPDSHYFVQMENAAVTDLTGNPVVGVLNSTALNFTTAPADTNPPIPVSSSPNANEEQVPVTSSIAAFFNEPIQAGTGYITISNGQGDTRRISVTDTRQISFTSGKTNKGITIFPSPALLSNTQYFVQVDKGAILDNAGNTYAGIQDNSFHFKTAPKDKTAPMLSANQVSLVKNTNSGIISFNEAVTAGSGSLIISNNQGDTHKIAIHDSTQVSFNGNSLVITPNESYAYNTDYSIRMDSGVITDFEDNPFAGVSDNTTLVFKTLPLDTTPPIPISASVNLDTQNLAPLNPSISVKFDEPVKSGSGHFIISNGQGDVHTIAANDLNQIQLGIDHSGEGKAPRDFTELAIRPSDALLANSHYFVLMEEDAVTDYVGNAVKPVLDTHAFNFNTMSPVSPDTTPPKLSDSMPRDDSFVFTYNNSVLLSFDEAVTLGSGRIIISNGHGDTRNIDINDKTQVSVNYSNLYISLTKPFFPGSTYSFQMDSGAITDLAGNAFAGINDNWRVNFFAIEDNSPPKLLSDSQNASPKAIYLYFNEAVKLGSGNITLNNGHGDIRQISVNDTHQVTLMNPGLEDFSPAASNGGVYLLISPAIDLLPGSQYFLQMDKGTLVDLAGNAFAGISDTTSHVFNISQPNITSQPPSLISFDQANGPSALATNVQTIQIPFNVNIKAGSGHIIISNGAGDIRTIDVNDTNQVSINDATSGFSNWLTIHLTHDLSDHSHYFIQLEKGAVTDLTGNAFAGVTDTTTIQFDTAGKIPGAASSNSVHEINHGSQVGIYENKDVLVFNFNTPIASYTAFKLNQHSFGGNDLIWSNDGLSASVTLTEKSTVSHGDVVTLTGVTDIVGHQTYSIEFKL